mgnify:CR=1 FL=1
MPRWTIIFNIFLLFFEKIVEFVGDIMYYILEIFFKEKNYGKSKG